MKKILIILLAIVAFGFTSNAQTPKFAHIDYEKVMDSIPTVLAAQAEEKQWLDFNEKKMMDMEKAYTAEYEAYQAGKDTMSQFMREMREKTLMQDLEVLEYTQQTMEQDYQILYKRLYEPIEKNLKLAIETVAKRHNITYMFEKTQLLYMDPNGGLDLTAEVRAELIRLETLRTP